MSGSGRHCLGRASHIQKSKLHLILYVRLTGGLFVPNRQNTSHSLDPLWLDSADRLRKVFKVKIIPLFNPKSVLNNLSPLFSSECSYF